MIHRNINASLEDFQAAAGSCEIMAKKMREEGLTNASIFLSGASAALRYFPEAEKGDAVGIVLATKLREGETVEP